MEVTQWGNPDPHHGPPMTLCAVMIYPQYYALSMQQPDHIIFLIKPLSLEMSETLNLTCGGRGGGLEREVEKWETRVSESEVGCQRGALLHCIPYKSQVFIAVANAASMADHREGWLF